MTSTFTKVPPKSSKTDLPIPEITGRVGGQSIDTDVFKYKVAPVPPEDDPYLPHRSKVRVGEVVDEWHVLQAMHTRAGELGERAYQV